MFRTLLPVTAALIAGAAAVSLGTRSTIAPAVAVPAPLVGAGLAPAAAPATAVFAAVSCLTYACAADCCAFVR